MKFIKFYFLVTIIFISGCDTATHKSFTVMNEGLHSTSISKEEAAQIGREYCLANSQCYKYCSISSLTVGENERWFPRQWIVSFRSKQLSTLDHSFFIHVDKDNGTIVRTDWNK